MNVTGKQTDRPLDAPCGFLPPQLRVLFIRGPSRPGGWLADALASDRACEVFLEEAAGATEGMSCLRDDRFDTILVSHVPGELDALELLDAFRTGSSADQPIIVLGEESEHEMAALCYEVGADAYLCMHTTTTRALLWQIARATERHRLITDHRQLERSQSQRHKWEHDEAVRLLAQQRSLADHDPARSIPALPTWLAVELRQLLRIYVVMGAGSLGDDVQQLATRLGQNGITARDALRALLGAAEEMVHGLGNRSARHLLNRTHLLTVELLLRLNETHQTQE
jgi:CheY-like chemotaxis protein